MRFQKKGTPVPAEEVVQPDPVAEAPPRKPLVDPFPKAPPMTATMVMSTAKVQTEAGRLHRLRALARSNTDVAWLLNQAGVQV